jgi:hypothetical protein
MLAFYIVGLSLPYKKTRRGKGPVPKFPNQQRSAKSAVSIWSKGTSSRITRSLSSFRACCKWTLEELLRNAAHLQMLRICWN